MVDRRVDFEAAQWQWKFRPLEGDGFQRTVSWWKIFKNSPWTSESIGVSMIFDHGMPTKMEMWGFYSTSWENFQSTTAYIYRRLFFAGHRSTSFKVFFHWEKVPHLQPLDFSLQPVTAFSALCWLNQHLCWSAGWVVSERGYTTSHYHYHSLWMVRMHELRICMKTYHFLHKFWRIFAFFSILQGITIIIRPHKTMQTTKMN